MNDTRDDSEDFSLKRQDRTGRDPGTDKSRRGLRSEVSIGRQAILRDGRVTMRSPIVSAANITSSPTSPEKMGRRRRRGFTQMSGASISPSRSQKIAWSRGWPPPR